MGHVYNRVKNEQDETKATKNEGRPSDVPCLQCGQETPELL